MNQNRFAYVSVLPAVCSLLMMNPVAAHAQKDQPVVVFSGSRSFLGVAVAEVTAERAKALKLREERGVEITRVEDDSPAAKAGFKVQDVVLEYQGQRVEGSEQFIRLVRETPAGREVKLLVTRGGQNQTLSAIIASRKMRTFESGDMNITIPRIDSPEIRMPAMPRALMTWSNPTLGIEAESLSSQLAEFFGVKDGVLVRSVTSGSAAEKAGIKAGDVITKVDETKVTSPAEISRALRSEESKETHKLAVVREKKEMSVTVTGSDGMRRLRGRSVVRKDFQF